MLPEGVGVDNDLVSQAEEEDMEALLGTYVFLFFFIIRLGYMLLMIVVTALYNFTQICDGDWGS